MIYSMDEIKEIISEHVATDMLKELAIWLITEMITEEERDEIGWIV